MIPARDRMIEDLRALGLRENGVLLVHASLRSLGNIEGGAETVIQALLQVLGKGGTLLMPALSYSTVGADNPYFDVRHTTSCVGALPEYFRQRQGTIRSIHPTHSVCAVGTQAHDMLRDHYQDATPCGSNSPFHKLPLVHGQILFLGCGLRPNTSMHGIEELVEPPYLYAGMVDYQITDADGKQTKMSVRSHNFKGWQQRYERLDQVLDQGSLNTGKVLDAACHLVDASAMWVSARQKLEDDPLFFVERESDANN